MMKALQTQFLSALKREKNVKGLFSKSSRLAIYQYAYFARIEESLAEDFPRTRSRIGTRAFSNGVKRYLQKHPSRYANLGEVSLLFPKFVGTLPLAKTYPYLKSLAQLELNTLLARIALEDCPAVSETDPKLGVRPSVHQLRTVWAVHQSRILKYKSPRTLVTYSEGNAVVTRTLSTTEEKALHFMRNDKTLTQFVAALARLHAKPEEAKSVALLLCAKTAKKKASLTSYRWNS